MELLQFLFWRYTILLLPAVFYKSESLEGLYFESDSVAYHIYDDLQDSITVNLLHDQHGNTFWYRHVDTEVCLTGDCKRVDVGIYWDITGDFKGLEVYKEPLTKTDHSDFKPWDYSKLMSIIENDWSILREYNMEELTVNVSDEVDGITGATKKEISEESVENAVYTTYTLWHLIHQGEKEQLARLSANILNKESYLQNVIDSNNAKYQQLILEQYTLGNIIWREEINQLIVKTLSSKENANSYRAALRALNKTPLVSSQFQKSLGQIYVSSPVRQKVELLSAFQVEKPLSAEFYDVLSQDLDKNNEWLAIKILQLLKHSNTHTKRVLNMIEELKSSSNQSLLNAINAISS